ncbi:uroporphyrinogen-III synthase [Oceanobacillus rekensis]|uniref:uroporphyrinogen-III synthase n=1 Tax=Oceanobacillus rekensis TaxID=937927 RepID=UPI000B43C76D|nr:uroporphyrinogen-III synthase [Oceanobacillus rekensis]
MKGLNGKVIGVAANRKADAISTLIQKSDGIPKLFPIQGEQQLNESICEEDVREFLANPFDMIVFTTGIGAETLENTAHHLNQHANFIKKLDHSTLAIRGSKTLKWMKKNSLSAKFIAEDGTMDNLLAAMSTEQPHTDKRLFLQAYNQDDVDLKYSFEDLGYHVYLSKPYQFMPPDNKTLKALKQNILDQTLDAVIFTSKTQVQNLFQHYTEEVIHAFNDKVLAVAIGKVTAAELEKKGIVNIFQSEKQKMGAMIVELNEHYKNNQSGNV